MGVISLKQPLGKSTERSKATEKDKFVVRFSQLDKALSLARAEKKHMSLNGYILRAIEAFFDKQDHRALLLKALNPERIPSLSQEQGLPVIPKKELTGGSALRESSYVIRLPSGLRDRVRLYAKESGTPMNSLIIEAIRRQIMFDDCFERAMNALVVQHKHKQTA